jgi:glycosyltransferase involved in cell wall biosynthesis
MKDHRLFLEAAGEVAGRYGKAEFVLLGAGVEESNRELIERVPEAVRNRFHFLGEQAGAAAMIAQMDVMCLSSAWGEAFPNVLGEAMASGVPCVATDVGDCRNLVGEAGRVVAPKDKEALARGLEELLAMGPEARRDLGERGRARVANEFSLDAVVGRYAHLYQELAQ